VGGTPLLGGERSYKYLLTLCSLSLSFLLLSSSIFSAFDTATLTSNSDNKYLYSHGFEELEEIGPRL